MLAEGGRSDCGGHSRSLRGSLQRECYIYVYEVYIYALRICICMMHIPCSFFVNFFTFALFFHTHAMCDQLIFCVAGRTWRSQRLRCLYCCWWWWLCFCLLPPHSSPLPGCFLHDSRRCGFGCCAPRLVTVLHFDLYAGLVRLFQIVGLFPSLSLIAEPSAIGQRARRRDC